MKTKSKLLRLSVVPTAMALAFLSNQGFADDQKVYPGSLGVRWDGADPSYYFSSIGNPSSTEWLKVDLPVINDDLGNDIGYSNVRVLDRNYSYNVSCSLNSVYWNGSGFSGYFGPKTYSSGSSDYLQYLYTGGVGGGTYSYHEYFSCEIPPSYNGNQSYIVSYYVDEY